MNTMREASLIEKLTMSPWKKWKLYRIFPTKFVIELLLIILTTVEIFLPILTADEHVQRCKQSFDDLFMPSFGLIKLSSFLFIHFRDYSSSDNRFHAYFFYKPIDVAEHIGNMTQKFLNLNKFSF